MKKNGLIGLCILMMFGLCACGSSGGEEGQPITSTEVVNETSTPALVMEDDETDIEITETTDISDAIDALGDIEVEENLFTVEITVPADYAGNSTQEDLDATVLEKGWKSATLNEDGSVTYVMSKKQHKELMDNYRETIKENLNALVGSESYPNFTLIEANDNFSNFTITTTSTELGFAESFSVMIFYMYGGVYSAYSGEPIDNVHVAFINADTGEVLGEANSSDAE